MMIFRINKNKNVPSPDTKYIQINTATGKTNNVPLKAPKIAFSRTQYGLPTLKNRNA